MTCMFRRVLCQQQSLMSLAEGRSQGHCYLWHHDEAYDLVPIGDNFDTAIKTVETGFISGDRRIRAFFA